MFNKFDDFDKTVFTNKGRVCNGGTDSFSVTNVHCRNGELHGCFISVVPLSDNTLAVDTVHLGEGELTAMYSAMWNAIPLEAHEKMIADKMALGETIIKMVDGCG